MAVTSDFGSESISSSLVWATKCLLSSMEEHGSSKPLVGGSSPSGDTNVGWLSHHPFKVKIMGSSPIPNTTWSYLLKVR